jgi:hypothetical protein
MRDMVGSSASPPTEAWMQPRGSIDVPEGGVLQRRVALRLLTSAVGGAMAIAPSIVEALAYARVHPSGFGLEVAERIDAATLALRRLEEYAGVRRVLPLVRQHADFITRLLIDGRQASVARHRLADSAADIQQYLGWLHIDLGDAAVADQHFRRGIEILTEQGSNPALHAHMLEWRGRAQQRTGSGLATNRFDRSGATTALPFLLEARAVAEHASPLVRAEVTLAAADVLAGYGDTHQGLAAVESAQAAFDAHQPGEEKPPWMRHLDERTVACRIGSRMAWSYLDLNRPSDAAELLVDLGRLPLLPSLQADVWLGLALVSASNGDVEQACDFATRTYALGEQTGSSRVVQAVRGLHARHLADSQDSAAVRQLTERLG